MTPKITDAGTDLMLMAMDGTGLIFTKMVLGSGDAPEDYKSLTGLVNPIVGAEIGLDDIAIEENYALIKGTLNNAELSGSFSWTEMGVYCRDPNDETREILYAYGHYALSDDEDEVEGAVPITKYSNNVVQLTINIYVYIGEVENVTAALAESSEYANKKDFEDHLKDANNPHNVTASQVGLGSVPNVNTNDQTPTYTATTTLAALTSGEKLSAAFGKIAKAISSLISHIRNTSNPHKVTYYQAGAAAASHNHSTGNITSGTLGIARGGTGGTTAETAMHSLFGIYAGTIGSNYRITSGKNLNSYTTGGTYWCANNDIAKTLSNCPYTDSNFLLLVFVPHSSHAYQMILPNKTGAAAMYIRSRNNETWGTWGKVSTTSV